MALIKKDKIERIEKVRNLVHDEVDSTYTIFTDKSGKKYFQIDTYGSKQREIKGKVSQSIQFDEDSILKLINIINTEFIEKSNK